MADQKIKVIIIGGGFAGMITAVRLAGKARRRVEITLVNGTDVFIRRLRLHEYATDQHVPQTPIATMLRGTGVKFVQEWVTAIHPEQHTVSVNTDSGQRELAYDKLVYALGSRVDQEAVPGVRDHAFVLNPGGPMGAPQLRERLHDLANASARVVVVGGGATGIEAAAQIKSFHPGFEVQIVTQGKFGAFKNDTVRRHMLQSFEKQGIAIRENVTVQAVEANAVIGTDGTHIPADLVLWAGGFKAPSLAKEAGLPVNERNQILVDSLLRSTAYPDIFAVGDSAWPVEEPGAPFRMSVFAALVSGAHVADNLARMTQGHTMKPLSFAYYGQAVTLGAKDAVGFATFPADQAVGPIYRGQAAVKLRNFFVWFLTFAIAMERIIPGFLFWMGKGRYAAAQRRARKQAKSRASA